MLFSSLTFLYLFLPIILAVYFIVPKRFKNFVILLASVVFYAWGEPKYVLVMAASVLIGYVFGIAIEKIDKPVFKKIVFIISIILNLGILGYFKYANFFVEAFSKATNLPVTMLHIALPIGISFYTFQLLSYIIDVYRGKVPAQKNFINLAAYITMFPQLIAGPIVRYSTINEQLINRTHSFDKAMVGIQRFIFGLAKKVILANSLGELCELFKSSQDVSVLYYWMYAIAFTLQIYFDFSGYSDMAIGLGKILGFDFDENFNYPYQSKSITEFWRRWHISLGTWFRDYVYIPLGGNRKGFPRQILNIIIVWFLTGFWHGADWTFMLWGLYFAVFLIIEKLWLKKFLDNSKVLSHIYVLLIVTVSFVIFNASGIDEAFEYLKCMFCAGNIPLVSSEFKYYLVSYLAIFAISAIGSTQLPKLLINKLQSNKIGLKIITVVRPIVMVALLLVCTAFIVDGSFNPFLYFRF